MYSTYSDPLRVKPYAKIISNFVSRNQYPSQDPTMSYAPKTWINYNGRLERHELTTEKKTEAHRADTVSEITSIVKRKKTCR